MNLSEESLRLRRNAEHIALMESGYRESRLRAIERDGGKCIVCGSPFKNVHHVIPFLKSFDSSLDNLVCLCLFHHGVAHGSIRPFLYSGDSRYRWNEKGRMIGFSIQLVSGPLRDAAYRYIDQFGSAVSEAEAYSKAVYRVVGKYVPVRWVWIPRCNYMALVVGRCTLDEMKDAVLKYGAVGLHEPAPKDLFNNRFYFMTPEMDWNSFWSCENGGGVNESSEKRN